MHSGANGTPRQSMRGSSFPKGPRRGADPEGSERSAWKGLTGPSGLNLDHGQIPEVERLVYDTLLPLVSVSEEPIPLSAFTSAVAELLLPVLPRNRELTPHEFKSQWGRLNEFVCPKLAELAGLGDRGYSREGKSVRLALAAPGASTAGPSLQTPPARTPPPVTPGSAPGLTAVPQPAPSNGGMPQPMVLPRPLPVVRTVPGMGLGAAPQMPLMPPPMAGPPACAYCHGPHRMKTCGDFHQCLQSIYQAGYQSGYQQGAAAAVAHPPACPQSYQQ